MHLFVCVAVVYFVFLICICVSAVVLTIVVQHMYLRSETKPFTAMPVWVSTCIAVQMEILLQCTVFTF